MTKLKKKQEIKQGEWKYPEADPKHPHTCSSGCKRPDTEAGCLGCPLA